MSGQVGCYSVRRPAFPRWCSGLSGFDVVGRLLFRPSAAGSRWSAPNDVVRRGCARSGPSVGSPGRARRGGLGDAGGVVDVDDFPGRGRGDDESRGVRDVFFLLCNGLKGLPEVVADVSPATIVQTCCVRPVKSSLTVISRSHSSPPTSYAFVIDPMTDAESPAPASWRSGFSVKCQRSATRPSRVGTRLLIVATTGISADESGSARWPRGRDRLLCRASQRRRRSGRRQVPVAVVARLSPQDSRPVRSLAVRRR